MDRAALITGGSSGIGHAIARALGEDGYRLTISARRPDKLEAAAQELRDDGLRRGGRARPTWRTRQEIQKLVAAHRERCGRLDVLINNAGIGIGGAVADAETKKLDLQLDVNLRAVYLLAREAIPMLKEAGAEHGKALMANTASIRRQARPGLAGGVLGDQVRRGRAEPGAPQGAVATTACR